MKIWVGVVTAPDNEGIEPLVVVGRTEEEATNKLRAEIARLAALPEDAEEVQIDADMWEDYSFFERDL